MPLTGIPAGIVPDNRPVAECVPVSQEIRFHGSAISIGGKKLRSGQEASGSLENFLKNWNVEQRSRRSFPKNLI